MDSAKEVMETPHFQNTFGQCLPTFGRVLIGELTTFQPFLNGRANSRARQSKNRSQDGEVDIR